MGFLFKTERFIKVSKLIILLDGFPILRRNTCDSVICHISIKTHLTVIIKKQKQSKAQFHSRFHLVGWQLVGIRRLTNAHGTSNRAKPAKGKTNIIIYVNTVFCFYSA